ncbi:hypothetical protein EJ08DRAFT_654800 [Tothia fuscella]|uniref:Uncharacterized protein n=1 Tax=Tothia fuscella TaxID=1048955 RepID=A0A9P4NDS7_9PEZI|nr:hypothetical protein EJ08DRAFT_654800 [Tothia fuscella]
MSKTITTTQRDEVDEDQEEFSRSWFASRGANYVDFNDNIERHNDRILLEAKRQLKKYYPIHSRPQHWAFLSQLNWSKYRHDLSPPPSRWSEEIQLGMYRGVNFYLRGTKRLLRYRSEPTQGSAGKAHDDEVDEETDADKSSDHGVDVDSNRVNEDSTSTALNVTESDEEDDEEDEEDDEGNYDQILIRIQFPSSRTMSMHLASPAFAQLGSITSRKQTDEKEPGGGNEERLTGYHLAVNLDNEYKPTTVWFLSTTRHKEASNTHIPHPVRKTLRFAAAQVASSLDQMNELHASELKFANVEEEYTILDWV